MNIFRNIALGVASLTIAATGVTIASAQAAEYSQWCVRSADGNFYAYAAETDEDYAYLASLPADDVQPFPNTALGCASYNDPAPTAEPTPTPEPTTATPSPTTKVKGPKSKN